MSARVADWPQGEPRLALTRCRRCGNRWYLPHAHCSVCGSSDAISAPAAGVGLCVAVTRLHATTTGRADGSALVLALVELDEGPLVMGRVHDDALAPGTRVRVAFHDNDDAGGLVPSFAREGLG